jgi:hypothetical protein
MIMENVDSTISSRRSPQGRGGFDVEKTRFEIALGKRPHRRRFRLIRPIERDTRARMLFVRKRPDCVPNVPTSLARIAAPFYRAV